MTEAERADALAQLDDEVADMVYGVDRDFPCRYGHFDCAEYERGPCANETFGRLFTREAHRRGLITKEVAL